MLVYRGEMPDELAADATITTLQKPFSYPISYGYCNVGRVFAVAEGATKFGPGDMVFAFREHCSAYVAHESDVLRVPSDIDPRNASMIPSVETAVSIAMDAALLPGESAVVVGQGCVGLLVATCLKLLHPLSAVVAIERDKARRELARTVTGADGAFAPEIDALEIAAQVPGFESAGADVSIDTSGQGAGLDTAIRLTRDGGKVVLASWFGSKTVRLTTLGGRFHRSHIAIVASQVSEIPAPLRARWTKQRRFALAWRLLRRIKPADRFSAHVADIKDAAQVFAEIDRGRHVQVVFKYGGE